MGVVEPPESASMSDPGELSSTSMSRSIASGSGWGGTMGRARAALACRSGVTRVVGGIALTPAGSRRLRRFLTGSNGVETLRSGTGTVVKMVTSD